MIGELPLRIPRLWKWMMMLRNWRFWVLISVTGLLLAGGALYTWLVVDLPSFHDLHSQAIPPTTKIYDRHDRLLYEIIDPHVGKHTPLPLDEIPSARPPSPPRMPTSTPTPGWTSAPSCVP